MLVQALEDLKRRIRIQTDGSIEMRESKAGTVLSIKQ